MLKLIADRATGSEPGFAPKTVRWAIWTDEQGVLVDVVSLGDEDDSRNRGRLFPKCPHLTQGELIEGGEIRSHFLVETAEVVALFVTSGEAGAKARAKHEYFVDLLREASQIMPALGAVAGSLGSDAFLTALRHRLTQLKAKPTDRVTFRVADSFVLESREWHEWWRGRRSGSASGADEADAAAGIMRCFLTGELVQPVLTHGKIKGLAGWGGQASGDALVSFDKEAFRSYGLEQSANAAMSEASMTAYVDGLNEMLRGSTISLAGTRVVYWFDRAVPPEDDPLPWLLNTEREGIDALARARDLFQSLQTGRLPELAGNSFYSLLLSGISGRVMVRDWACGRFQELAHNIWRWFDDLAVVSILGDGLARSPAMERVITSLLPKKPSAQEYKDWVRPIGPQRIALWHAAVRGDQIAFSTLAEIAVLCRPSMIRGAGRAEARESDQVDPYTLQTRMGLIKAYHLRKARWEGDETVVNQLGPSLNEDHPSPAYQCGRLLAVLARLQQRALGDVGAGVVERYYAAASSTPALVLGRLTRTSQFHLNKLDPGLARWWDDRIAGIWSRLGDSVPQTLSLEEQSLFALGYYQQLADMRKRRENDNETAKEGQR